MDGLLFQAVVNPFALTARLHQASAPQIGEVAGNAGLIGFENALEVADADFAVAHEMQKPQTIFISQGREEEGARFHGTSYTP